MNRLPAAKRAQLLQVMAEGVSIRDAVRLTGVSKNTVTKLLVEAGEAFSAYMDNHFRNVPCKRIQVDEIWSFVCAKAKNIPTAKTAPDYAGDVWTWTARCTDTKLVPSFYVGSRDAFAAYTFMHELADRLASRVQLASEGNKAYLDAVEGVFGNSIPYAMLVEHYGPAPDGPLTCDGRPQCIETTVGTVTRNPDQRHISTFYTERQNLSMRMAPRRFTQHTNACSKKLENHAHAIAIYLMHYNFVRIHPALRATPAMAAGVTDKLLDMADLVAVVDSRQRSTAHAGHTN